MAEGGDASAYDLPRPMKGRAGCDFSFSGLKTAVRQHVDKLPDGPIPRDVAVDLAAAFQQAVAEAICDRAANAVEIFQNRHSGPGALVVAGGVAANTALRAALERTADAAGIRLVAPPPKLCTDNGAMIAWAGLERFRLGLTDDVDFAPRPRWPLDETAPPRPYAGVKA
jgi:N6-L-threonylcarbamoyladenine synthase